MPKRSRSTLLVSVCLMLALVLTLTLACKATPIPAPKPTTPAASPSPTTPKPTTPAVSPSPTTQAPTPTKPTTAAPAQPVHLRMVTIAVGGSWYVLGGVLSTLLTPYLPAGSSIEVQVGPGFTGNPVIIDKGDAELGCATNVNAYAAVQGTGGAAPLTHLRGLAGGFAERVAINWARKSFPYNSMREAFAAKYPVKMFIYAKGSAAYDEAQQLLKLYGVTEDDIKSWGGSVTFGTYDVMAEYMKGGKIDLWFGGSTVKGHPTLTEVSLTTDTKFVPFESDIIDKMIAQNGYIPSVQGAGWFKGQPDALKSFAVSENLIVRDSVPDSVVYALTKSIVEQKDKIIAAYASAAGLDGAKAAVTGIDLHPGAAKYYKEAGFIK